MSTCIVIRSKLHHQLYNIIVSYLPQDTIALQILMVQELCHGLYLARSRFLNQGYQMSECILMAQGFFLQSHECL